MAIEPVIEEVADQIEEVAHTFPGYAILGGFFIGAGVGYLVARKLLEKQYEKQAASDIKEMREYYEKKSRVSDQKPPMEEIIKERGYATEVHLSEEITLVEATPQGIADVVREQQAIYETQDHSDEIDAWSYEDEIPKRSPDSPYIIHSAEFRENEPDHEQATFTFYEQDEVVCDMRDEIVDDIDNTVGIENLKRFGHGSLDAQMVYVRNERLRLDFEIVTDPRSYSGDIQGLRHSARMRHQNRHYDRKLRPRDE